LARALAAAFVAASLSAVLADANFSARAWAAFGSAAWANGVEDSQTTTHIALKYAVEVRMGLLENDWLPQRWTGLKSEYQLRRDAVFELNGG
jgi:hypothetical protein